MQKVQKVQRVVVSTPLASINIYRLSAAQALSPATPVNKIQTHFTGCVSLDLRFLYSLSVQPDCSPPILTSWHFLWKKYDKGNKRGMPPAAAFIIIARQGDTTPSEPFEPSAPSEPFFYPHLTNSPFFDTLSIEIILFITGVQTVWKRFILTPPKF